MDEQAGPVQDEVERALASMRAGFLSGTDQITGGVVSLEEHLDEAPFEVREAVRNAVSQIVAAHERLKLKMEHLPASSWDQFKIMVSVVKVQQTLLDQLGQLVKEHVVPRQVPDLSMPAFPDAPEARYEPGPQQAQEPPPIPLPRRPPPPRRRPPPPPQQEVRDDDSDPERQPLIPLSRERVGAAFSGLIAMVVAGVVLSHIPRDLKLQEVGTWLVEMVGPAGDSASSPGPDTAAKETPAPPPRVVVRLPEERAPPPARIAIAAPPERKITITEDAPQPVGVTIEEKNVAAPPPREEPAAAEDPPAEPAAKKKRVAAVEPPPAKAPDDQFVPVLFTHKDRATALRALGDLKRQYPSLLVGRQGKVLPVNLGKKGVWHRLVLLPPAPRPDVAELCSQLMAEGYDRCWVKAYSR